MSAYRVIDLFAGAGGLTLGFTQTERFTSVLAVEFDRLAADTYARNFRHCVFQPGVSETRPADLEHHVFCGDIRGLGPVDVPADLVIGGPPCQGFSPLGKMTALEAHKNMNQLWQEYMRVVHRVRPLGFVIENVPQILRSREYLAIERVAELLGYTVRKRVLKAVQHGVPQRRERAFIVGLLGGIIPEFPEPQSHTATVRDAIGDLEQADTVEEIGAYQTPSGAEQQNLHVRRQPTEKSLQRYAFIEPGENRFALAAKAPHLTPRCWLEKPKGTTDVFGRLRWDKPSYTIRTEFFKPEKGCYLHPSQHRPITHREAARLQTFPDWFWFEGSKTAVARQIGNAVPPELAQALAQKVAEALPLVERQMKLGWTAPAVDFEQALAGVLESVYCVSSLEDLLPLSGQANGANGAFPADQEENGAAD